MAGAPATAIQPSGVAPQPAGEPICPTASTYPAPNGLGKYSVVIKADLKNVNFYAGWNEQFQHWQNYATGITAKTCGLLQIPSLEVDIQASGVVFDYSHELFTSETFDPTGKPVVAFGPGVPAGQAKLHLTPLGSTVTRLSGVNPDGTVNVNATATATAHLVSDPTSASAFDCTTTTTTVLSTARSLVVPTGRGPQGPVQVGTPLPLPPWTVEGTPLTGPIQHAHALVVANNFPVPIFDMNLNDPKNKCGPFGAEFNAFAGGVDSHDQAYFNGVTAKPGDVQPPGVTWVTGDLNVTYLDPAALPDGPPAKVPGT